MNLSLFVTDNIVELLVKIIEFTQQRQKALIRNINNMHLPGFVPKDLDAEEFSALLHDAIGEYARSKRLLLRDTHNIKFGTAGSFTVEPVIDQHAKELLVENLNEYLELQLDRLLENSLNQRVAAELVRQKQGIVSAFE